MVRLRSMSSASATPDAIYWLGLRKEERYTQDLGADEVEA